MLHTIHTEHYSPTCHPRFNLDYHVLHQAHVLHRLIVVSTTISTATARQTIDPAYNPKHNIDETPCP